MIFRITYVDMNGYCGREFHPEGSDQGLLVSAVGMFCEVYKDSNPVQIGDSSKLVNGAEPHVALRTAAAAEIVDYRDDPPQPYSDIVRVWICVTEDKRTLWLMDHEVELVQS